MIELLSLQEWKRVAERGNATELREFTLAWIATLARAVGVEPDCLRGAMQCADDDVVCGLIVSQAQFSIDKLNGCSPKSKRRKR